MTAAPKHLSSANGFAASPLNPFLNLPTRLVLPLHPLPPHPAPPPRLSVHTLLAVFLSLLSEIISLLSPLLPLNALPHMKLQVHTHTQEQRPAISRQLEPHLTSVNAAIERLLIDAQRVTCTCRLVHPFQCHVPVSPPKSPFSMRVTPPPPPPAAAAAV